MGEALSLKKVQISILAAVAAIALGFTMFGAQAAFADEGQYQAGSLAIQSDVTEGVEVVAGKSAEKAEYTVTSTTKNTVTYSASETKGTSAKIPATVKIGGKTYKVTTVDTNAFKGNNKIKNVTVGKNITKIKPKAFKGAKKLTTLKINTTKLKAKGVKNALKGSNVKTVKVPKAQLAKYKKIFSKKNCGKKVTVKAA